MQKECEYCGYLFSGQRTNRKYCSDNCKQMAYYKRNGLVLANFSGYDSSALPEKENGSAKTVKYDSSTEINDALLNAIADRLLILLEDRIAERIGNLGGIGNVNVKDTVNVKPYFTDNDTQNYPTYNSQPYEGISFQRASDNVRGDVPAIVKHDNPIITRPTVKRDEITVKHTRKRKNRYQPLASVPLQDEKSEQLSEAETNERQSEELELALRNFTVSDETLPDQSVSSENETPVNKELRTPLENQSVDSSSTNSKMIVQEKKPESVKYEWVDSPFINQIEDYISSDFTDLSGYRHEKQYIKVLECFKCLTWTLVQLSNRPKVDPDTFLKVATAFSYLTQSSAFSEVPANYPYYSLLVEMKEKICAVAESKKICTFKLSPKRKAILIAVRYQMGGHIKDLKFSELFLQTPLN